METAEPFVFPTPEAIAEVRKGVNRTGEGLRLPFRQRSWRGSAGNWAGVGIGSSIDFQDHRPYVPGDDPRYINWQAFARNGQYTMKLYREEVAPRVDLALDCSPSMFAWPEKAARSLALTYFCADSARRHGASLRAYVLRDSEVEPIEGAALDHPHATPFRPQFPVTGAMPSIDRIPWRRGAIRVLISDLLFEGNPDKLLGILAHAGSAIVLAPWHWREATPDWQGNVEFVDVESGNQRPQLVDRRLGERYRNAYQQHLATWTESARRHRAAFARVSCGDDLAAALLAEALPAGAVEQCN